MKKKNPLTRVLSVPKGLKVSKELIAIIGAHKLFATFITAFIQILISGGKIAIVGFVASGVNKIVIEIPNIVDGAPMLFESTLSRIGCAVAVFILGFFFFWLRESYRHLYAFLEIGVAVGTAYNAAAKLYHNSDTYTAILTLMGSVYIAVRAVDNYDKWHIEQEVEEAGLN